MIGRLCFILMLVLLCCFIVGTSAQTKIGAPISEEQFERLSEALDYSKTKKSLVLKKPVKEKTASEDKGNYFWQYNTLSVFKVLAFLIILILVIFIIYVVFSNVKIQKKQGSPDLVIASEEENIKEIDAHDGYLTALANADYRLAVRMQFIRVLQYLSESGFIIWKPNKTNRQYLIEIEDKNHYVVFKELSYIYDLVWYGHTVISNHDFDRINPKFQKFLEANV
ncbi:MAG: hypothetical protein IPL46_04455 [Saprospiraceae bacterium]|nr:hypothetical protein [Saprospiraceae bacterium]